MTEVERLHLLEGLVGPIHLKRYQMNPWFKLAIDQLVQYLPFIVAGLVAQADKENERLQSEVERINHVIGSGVQPSQKP